MTWKKIVVSVRFLISIADTNSRFEAFEVSRFKETADVEGVASWSEQQKKRFCTSLVPFPSDFRLICRCFYLIKVVVFGDNDALLKLTSGITRFILW